MRASRARTRLVLAFGVGALLAATTAPAVSRSSSQGASASVQSLFDGAGRDVPFTPALASVSCPYERGPVKEGSDADRYKVTTTINYTTISYLRGRAKPSTYPRNNRLYPYEDRTWQVNSVYLTQWKQESDGDFHLVLKDSAGRSMIAEVPYGGCVPSTSRWRAAIAGARSTVTGHVTVTTSWHYGKRLVDIRGIAIFDPPHGQTGAAPNGIELHPVIAIHFH